MALADASGDADENHPRWLISYKDWVSLVQLCIGKTMRNLFEQTLPQPLRTTPSWHWSSESTFWQLLHQDFWNQGFFWDLSRRSPWKPHASWDAPKARMQIPSPAAGCFLHVPSWPHPGPAAPMHWLHSAERRVCRGNGDTWRIWYGDTWRLLILGCEVKKTLYIALKCFAPFKCSNIRYDVNLYKQHVRLTKHN